MISDKRPTWIIGTAALAVCALLPIFVPDLFSDYALDIALRFLIYLALAEAWNLLAGYCGLVSLGSAAFVGAGGYVFVVMMNGYEQPVAVALLASAAAGALIAVTVSRAVFRLRGLFFTVGTLALAESLRLFMINAPWFGGSTGFFLSAEFPTPTELYGWALGLVFATEVIAYAILHTRVSVILRALRDDEDAAAQMGVRPFRVKLALFATVSAIMAVAGGIQAYKVGAIEPYGMFGLSWSVDVLVIVMIGGLGIRYGALIGTVFVLALSELLADFPELHLTLTGIILILVIRFAPKGIAGLATNVAGLRGSSPSAARRVSR